MIEILLGSLIGLFGFTEAVDTKPVAPGTVNITQSSLSSGPLREAVVLEPQSQLQLWLGRLDHLAGLLPRSQPARAPGHGRFIALW